MLKALSIAGLASACLLQAPCTFQENGFSVLPNWGEMLVNRILSALCWT
jgi:hypothetical protein